ncbi:MULTISPECIES: pyridoxal-phosphate dependent enzyme [unclassified Rhizobium]|jgi:L-serine/L-threonine ammonia-lyase|uniref:pyridoxal-phosphate dependent enzyme n=1 Tax=unclassified Rhizobium TaxID=2613769 RepID=UPI00064692A3|nr:MULTISPECIES: pyridoxal-phosphate dependent enzyme [unclassified Rhizobium]MBN8951751.1 pyridoxal-phosphate dependent enzyme [Rhizobium tropici]OJY73996.1 MAG: serine dehydratase [Rhizobium sp. 60-20]RKD61700.1 L-serine ammonia-lyase [Rhizobium sp. WW_1]
MPLHLETPLLESRPLSQASGRSIWLKMDALQPPGSFKIRGIGAACEHHARNGKRRFVSSSGGNAGIAVAYAGRRLSIPVSVFVPETTTDRAKALIRQEGAEVFAHGASWQEANERALQAIDAEAAFIHPFDDPLLWTGHATMIDEVVKAGVPFDAVVLSVGGGGLLAGVSEGLDRNGLQHIPIIAAETDGAASLAAAVKAGEPVELPAITSIATSLGARKVSTRAFEITRTRPVDSVVVDDRAAVDACLRFLDDHRVLVEPACGAALAVAYTHADRLARFERVLMIACGGATATLAQLQAWQVS